MFEVVDYPTAWDGKAWLHRPRERLHPIHHHEDLELNLVVRGSTRYVVGESRYDLGPGSLLWLFPDQEHQLIEPSNDLACWILVIRRKALSWIRRDPFYHKLLERDPPGSWARLVRPAVQSQLVDLFADLPEAPPGRLNPGIRYAVIRAWDAYHTSPEQPGRALHPAVARAAAAIARDPGIALTTVARAAGLSLSRLEHLFRDQLDTTLTSHRTSLRIARFEDLVRKDPHRSLIHHALTAGFGSYPQFHRAFRTVTGRTPGAWAAEQTGSL